MEEQLSKEMIVDEMELPMIYKELQTIPNHITGSYREDISSECLDGSCLQSVTIKPAELQ